MSETVDTAVALCRANWRPFAAIVAFVTVPFQFLVQFLTRGSYSGFAAVFDPSVAQARPSSAAVVATWILSLVSFLVVRPFLTAAMIRAISAASLGEDVDVAAVYRFALRRFGSVLWVQFLEVLALVAAFVGLAIVGGMFAAVRAPALIALVVIGGVLALGVLYVRWVLGTSVVVVEDVRGPRALARSWELTRSSFWRLLGTLLLASLLATIIGLLIAAPAEAASLVVPGGWLLRVIGGVVSSIVTTPFISAVTVLLYLDARIRREGLDIALMLREIVAMP